MKNPLFAVLILCLAGCHSVDVATGNLCPEVEVADNEYHLSILESPVLEAGTWSEIPVCVHRGLGMEAPVILLAQGMPEYVEVETRENRLEDIGPMILRVRTASEEEAFGESPGPSRVRRFTVVGFSGLEAGHETVSVNY